MTAISGAVPHFKLSTMALGIAGVMGFVVIVSRWIGTDSPSAAIA